MILSTWLLLFVGGVVLNGWIGLLLGVRHGRRAAEGKVVAAGAKAALCRIDDPRADLVLECLVGRATRETNDEVCRRRAEEAVSGSSVSRRSVTTPGTRRSNSNGTCASSTRARSGSTETSWTRRSG
jgi:hypothetical protein